MTYSEYFSKKHSLLLKQTYIVKQLKELNNIPVESFLFNISKVIRSLPNPFTFEDFKSLMAKNYGIVDNNHLKLFLKHNHCHRTMLNNRSVWVKEQLK